MTKITVTDASGTKTVDMTTDTLAMSSTGPATWTIEAEPGSQIQYTRHGNPIPLTKHAEPDVWEKPRQFVNHAYAPLWIAADGTRYPLSRSSTPAPGQFVQSTVDGAIVWQITPPDGVTDGGPFASYTEIPPGPLL